MHCHKDGTTLHLCLQAELLAYAAGCLWRYVWVLYYLVSTRHALCCLWLCVQVPVYMYLKHLVWPKDKPM
jgi:hypothetical protein